MPFKDKEKQKAYVNAYSKGRFSGAVIVTKHHLGGKCVECGNTTIKELAVHHNPPLKRQHRQISDFFNLEELDLRCNEQSKNKCHRNTPSWRERQ